MAQQRRSDGFDPDLVRRLREFQGRVRRPASPRRAEPVVPARAPLSATDAEILLVRLRQLSPVLADSLEQALTDLNDNSRLSYVGTAGEVREVLRAAVQQLAPDDEIKKQPWYEGIQQGGRINPSQSERTRYAVQHRGGDKDQVKGGDDLIDALVGRISRQTYNAGSSTLHAGARQKDVRKLTRWIFAVLDEVLPE